jgi:uncharacterized RDD family membrane protein YckC
MTDDRRDLTSGDPLGGTPEPQPQPPAPRGPEPSVAPSPARPGPAQPPAATPERPDTGGHYAGGRVPPGAFAPREPRPGPPAKADLAEWWRRAVATLIDGAIVGAITLAILAVLGVGFFANGTIGAGEIVVGLLVGTVVFAALALLYAPLFMARTNGQTLGKMMAGCRVVRTDGKRVDFWWAALREVAVKGILLGIASSLTGGIAYLVDVLWPLPDPENRALHDYVVDSRVVKA